MKSLTVSRTKCHIFWWCHLAKDVSRFFVERFYFTKLNNHRKTMTFDMDPSRSMQILSPQVSPQLSNEKNLVV